MRCERVVIGIFGHVTTDELTATVSNRDACDNGGVIHAAELIEQAKFNLGKRI